MIYRIIRDCPDKKKKIVVIVVNRDNPGSKLQDPPFNSPLVKWGEKHKKPDM